MAQRWRSLLFLFFFFFLCLCNVHATASGPLAAFSILDTSDNGRFGLLPRVGRAVKHPSNPLWGQDQPWELRIDNGAHDV